MESRRPNDFDWTLLARYLAGELPPDEAARLEGELGAAPERARMVDQLRLIWEGAGEPGPEWDAAAALDAVKAAARRAPEARRHFMLPSAPLLAPTVVAASLLLATAAGGWLLRDRLLTSEPALSTELVTRRGQQAELTLPDGSRITLGAASQLRYATREFSQARDLYLDGEAYFEVAHDPLHPLRVHSRRSVTEDVGTAFAVSDHPESPFRVVVREGTVMLRRPGPAGAGAVGSDSLRLDRAELGQIGTDGRLTRRRNVDVDSYLAWSEGRLVFRETPLSEVLFRLGTWYDVDLVLGDSALADRPFTASFERETSDEVLRVLATALDLRYQRRGSVLLVLPAHPLSLSRP